jgi:D-alanyl-D-alanine carboxypeptidase
MRKKIIAILLTALFLMSLLPAPYAQADNTDSFDINSLRERYAILVDATDPTTALYGIEKNADDRCSTGSTIKILTCMLAIESNRLDEVATVSDNAVNFNKKYNSLMGLEAGEEWKISDLLYGLMLPSGNDAAIAIAEHLSGSTSAFAKLMNDKAKELGMTHSHFTTVHGKDEGKADNPKNYSTARDMAILTAWALQNDTFRRIVSATTYTCSDIGGHHKIVLQNTNRLLIDAVGEGYTPISCLYKDAIGVKTGDTNSAGKCFIAAASRGGVTLIAVLLGGTLDDPDYLARSANMNPKTKDPYNAQRFEDAIALFDFGFRKMSKLLTVQDLIDMGLPVSFTAPIKGYAADDPDGIMSISPKLDTDMKIQLMKPYVDMLEDKISEMAVPVIGTLVPPINAGDMVGTVEYRVGDQVILTSKLYADRSVKEKILKEDDTDPVVIADQQAQTGAGAQLMGSASTLSGEPVKTKRNGRQIGLIVLVVLLVLVVIAFVVFLIIVRIRRERRRKARAAARRRKRMQQERIARQRAVEMDKQK